MCTCVHNGRKRGQGNVNKISFNDRTYSQNSNEFVLNSLIYISWTGIFIFFILFNLLSLLKPQNYLFKTVTRPNRMKK